MKRLAFTILIFILTIAFGYVSNTFAQPSQDFYVQEHQKGIFKESTRKPKKKGYAEFAEDRETIINQLEIITGDEETRYIIVPGDTLTIAYQDRKDRPTAVYKVSGDGLIHMPLIGAVKMSGLNRQQARAQINQMYMEYIRHPKVSILVNSAGRFMVVGAAGPGVYDMTPNLTVFEAILQAGYNPSAAKFKSVMLMRGGIDDPVVKKLDLKKMMKKGDRSDNVLVKPGDLIYVPTKIIYNLDKFKNIVMRYVLDYYTLGGEQLIPEEEESSSTSN